MTADEGRASALTLMKRWYERIQPWVVYTSVVIVILLLYLGGFLGPFRDVLWPAATGILIGFGIQSLQTIERQTAPDASEDFDDEEAALGDLARLVSADRKVIHVKVIAATGWTTVDHVLPELMSHAKRNAIIDLEMQVIDTNSPLADAYPPHWEHEVEQTLATLRRMLANSNRLHATVRAYLYLPPIHGILIDDHSLLAGTFGWTGPETGRVELRGAESPHRMYRRGDRQASQIFELFDGWFEHVPSRLLYSSDDDTDRSARAAGRRSNGGAIGTSR